MEYSLSDNNKRLKHKQDSHAQADTLINDYLEIAIDIGAEMLISGAEINRIEDTISRICKAYGADKVDVISMNYVIMVTVRGERIQTYTQTRRIPHFMSNLDAVSDYNSLSRQICSEYYTPSEIRNKINEIKAKPRYSLAVIALAYAIISASFTFFFGGLPYDAFASGIIGVGMAFVESFLKRLQINRFLIIAFTTFVAGSLSILAVNIGVGYSSEIISMGNIMVLVTGLLFTNAIRDLFMDNMLSGSVRIISALLVVLAIGFGFALSSLFWR